MNSLSRVALAPLLGVAALLSACGDGASHNALAPSCSPNCPAGGPGPIGIGVADAGGDGALDAPDALSDAETGAVAATVIGRTAAPFGLATNPATANVDTTIYSVTAARLDASTTTTTTAGGQFTLPDVAVSPDGSWFQVSQGTRVRTLALFPLAATTPTVTGLSIPVYNDEVLNGANANLGLVFDPTKATVVIQVAKQSAAGAVTFSSGVTAGGNSSGFGPYYDDGTDSVVTGTKTSTRGTVAFLNVVPDTSVSTFAATLNAPGPLSVRAHTVAGAVTYVLLVVAGP